MHKKSNVTVIIRTTGEQTEHACKNILASIFDESDIFTVANVAPFSAAVKKTFEIGISRNKPWTFAVDADALLLKDAVINFLGDAESFLNKNKVQGFGFEGKLFDKLLGMWREVGHHLYRTELLPTALKFIDSSTSNLRPETYVKKEMARLGYGFFISNHTLGIHDFFQSPAHIAKKSALHYRKHPNAREMLFNWERQAAADSDFYWAAQGAKAAVSQKDQPICVDYKFMDNFLKQANLPAAEYSQPVDLDKVSATLAQYGKCRLPRSEFYNVFAKYKKSILKKIFNKSKTENWRAVTILGIRFKYKKNKKRKVAASAMMTESEAMAYLDHQVHKRAGYHINWSDPKTFNEKMNWLKIYWHDPLITQHADKYAVREVIKSKLGEKYLVPLFGAWDSPDEIDFSQLPEQFVLKVNWGCGQNIIVKNKEHFDADTTRKLLREWLKPENNNYWGSLEWGYKNIAPKITAEQYLTELGSGLPCYKVMCFNGQPRIIQVVYDDKQPYSTVDYFDLNWSRLPFIQNLPNNPTPCPAPSALPEMLEAAKTISAPFPFARIDFFSLKHGPLFSECTFYSNAGTAPFHPAEWDRTLGDMIALPQKKA